MKHTPGPWKVFQCDFNIIGVESENSIIVNNICDREDTETKDLLPELMANANLIASAPDLLEACKSAISAISTPGQGPKYAVKILQSAIAKVDK